MKRFKVAVIGATGMVGQRFMLLLAEHPWFELTCLAASASSAGKTYEEAVGNRWAMDEPIPEKLKNIVVMDATKDAALIAGSVDFAFCAVNMPKADVKALEETYVRLECPIMSNNSANRMVPDVPMIIPEINPQHAEIIPYQRKRFGTKRGFVAAKSNCSIQSYVPAINALMDYEPEKICVTTYQAISGAGKTFARMPEILDNIIPYIGGEEEKSEVEPMKVWGHIENGAIIPAASPVITAQCLRVPVSNGHMAAVFASFKKEISEEEIISRWESYQSLPQKLGLPSAPKQFIHYFTEADRPQTKLDRNLEGGMAVSCGRLRKDSMFQYKFVSLSHNTLRGAAGGGVEMAELLAAEGYLD